MRKLHVLMFAVAALFAFMAVAATSAFAFNELLWNGALIAESLPFEIDGELLLHDLNNGVEVLCKGILDGTVFLDGKTGEITEVLDLATKTLLAVNAPNLALVLVAGDHIDESECTVVKVCESPVPGDVLLVALKLPWDMEVIAGTTEIHLLGVEYNLDCLLLGVLFENTCSGEAWARILNDPVTGDAAAKFEEILPHLICDNGDEATALSDEENSDIIHPLGGLFTWS